RHTRSYGDWSSDVCSSDLGAEAAARELSQKHGVPIEIVWLTPPAEDGQVQAQRIAQAVNEGASAILISCSDAGKVTGAIDDAVEIGRASCRERAEEGDVAV